MGLAASWLAFHGIDRARVLERLRLAPNGQVRDIPNRREIGVRDLPSQWTLVFFGDLEPSAASENSLERCSSGCRIVAGHLEEHVMFSAAEEWRDGKRLWRIEHEGDADTLDVTVTGSPPENFEDLKRHYFAAQEAEGSREAEVDHIFDIPLALASSIVGYKHDESPMATFELVEHPKSESAAPITAAKPWWRLW
jgi:hypothetical protein